MALQASDFPSSSSSSSFSYKWRYDVFLSFRGSDTRHGFTGNLYKALSDKGIHTFFDDQELQGGEEITPALVKAIQDSRIAIVVFSVDYASSSFCLHELTTIMDCVKGMGRLVLPVFYDVDPCDVRHHQKGSYGEAMTKHEERFKHDKEKVQKWKEALRQAADLSGMDFKLGNEYEYVFIQNIVKIISKKISRVPLHIADYPIGLEFRVLEVNSLLNDGFDGGVLMVGIYGIGGIGKSTLARAIYNFIADQFECSCFLENVREKTIKFGLVHLQEMLLFEMLGEKDIKLGSVHEGISMIKHRLHKKKVLLVLDDVDKLKQLRNIAGLCNWFGSGSKVIITTRDTHLLASHGVKRKYEVQGLSKEEALELLRWNAFKDGNIDPAYMDILKHAVTCACGLPLALEVIGSKLFGKSIEEWRSALNQYEIIPDGDIQKILEISFHDLEECQRKIFLDIVCFSNGYYWPILHARHDVSLEYGISVLVQKSLIKINMFGYVTLHDLIRDMGREIIRQESPKHPGNRSRLWIPEDVIQVLEENTGTSQIEIMILDAPILEKIVVEWDGETFKTMRNLEILIIRGAHFSQGAKHLPNSLRVLEWWNYPSNSLPSDFYPKKLAIFKLPRSCLMSVGFIEKRKFMDLTVLKLDKSNIEYIPNVSGVPNLEILSFQSCENLIKVHESVGFLNKLSQLSASSCSKLRSFPALMLPYLAELDFVGCSSLENFPEILGPMGGIKRVYLYHTSIKELPYSFTKLRNLESLSVGDVVRPYEVSGSISMWHDDLNVHGCGELQFPKEDERQGSSVVSSNVVYVSFEFTLDEFCAMFLSLFGHVVTLDLSGNDFTILPEGIKEFCSLRKLTLDDCKELREIRGIPPNIEEFFAANCVSCTILPESFKELYSLRKLTLDGWRDLREIRRIPPNIEEFTAVNCMSLTILPESMKELCSMRKLTLDNCRELREIRGVPPNIEEFYVANCMSLTILLKSFKELYSLRKLTSDDCKELREIRGIPPNIEEFSVAKCMSLTILPESFKELCLLRKLTLDNCRELREIRGVPPNIEEFSVAKCMSLTILLKSFKELYSLRKLTLDDCKELREIRGIPPNIEEFSVANCMSLTILPESFKELCLLRKLTLDNCKELREIGGIPPNIEEFSAANCMSLTILPENIKELCSLRKLTLDGCRELREIRGIPPNIEEFSAVNCVSLTPSCRSMILNEENYTRNGYGYKRFYLPGGSIPKWFEHSSRNSISFWFRNKPPSISVCVCRPHRFDFLDSVYANVYINGCEMSPLALYNDCWFKVTEDYMTISNQGRILAYHDELAHGLPSENEWNHVVIVMGSVSWNMEGFPLEEKFGIHVHRHESDMEDIRFTDPLLQEKEVNTRDFHRDTELEKNLTTLASVETQQ